jgi:PAS domain S-box-containing protein
VQPYKKLQEISQSRGELEVKENEIRGADDNLSALRELNVNIVQSIRDGVASIDRDFRITFWNKAMEDISGYAAEEILGKVASQFFPHLIEEGVDDLIKNSPRKLTAERLNVPYHMPNGKSGYWNEKRFLLLGLEEKVVGVLVVVEDVTEMLRLEQQLVKLQEEIRDRKLIDVAKDILMRKMDLSLSEAHKFIMRKSQENRIKVVEVAKQVISLLGTPEDKQKFTQ